MKKFKKLMLVAATLTLACSLGAVAACSDGGSDVPEGGIEGDYEEVTSTELNSAIGKIDPTKLVNPYDLGLKLDVASSETIDLGNNVKAGIDASAKLDVKANLANYDINGKGNATIKTNVSNGYVSFIEGITGQSIPAEAKPYLNTTLSGDAYVKNSVFYGDAKVNNQTLKAKVDLLQLMDGAMNYATAVGGPNYGAMLTTVLDQYGVSIKMDSSDGYKFELTAGKDSVWKIFESQANITATDLAALKTAVVFNTFDVRAYISISSASKLEAVAVTYDIDVSLDFSKIPNYDHPDAEAIKGTIKANGHIKADVTSVTISAPNGFKESDYIDVTDEVKGLMGGHSANKPDISDQDDVDGMVFEYDHCKYENASLDQEQIEFAANEIDKAYSGIGFTIAFGTNGTVTISAAGQSQTGKYIKQDSQIILLDDENGQPADPNTTLHFEGQYLVVEVSSQGDIVYLYLLPV